MKDVAPLAAMRNGSDNVYVRMAEIFECFRGRLLICERQLLWVCHLHRLLNLSPDRAATQLSCFLLALAHLDR
jgi:hypothetical protein